MMNSPTRRRFLNTLSALGLAGVVPVPTVHARAKHPDGLDFDDPVAFSFDALVDQARRQAADDYRPAASPSPDLTRRINYDIHGKIRFPAEKALFQTGEGRYPVTFFHLGMYFQKPVSIHAVSGGESARLKYRADYFDMPSDSIARKMPDDAGFAGFRLHEDRARDD